VCVGATANIGLTGVLQVAGHVYITGTCIADKFNASSDYRIKENVVSIDLLEYNVDNLKPVIYNHKTDGSTNIGFLAHEVQEHFPFLVLGLKDGSETQSINYTGLIGLLTKEIQELKKDNKKIKEILFNIENRK
jgi:FtsZ-binding cell division protein ZapB